MINYGKHCISKTDIKSVVDVFKSDFLTQGQTINKFESLLNKYFGSKYCCVVSNGTAALDIAIKIYEKIGIKNSFMRL